MEKFNKAEYISTDCKPIEEYMENYIQPMSPYSLEYFVSFTFISALAALNEKAIVPHVHPYNLLF